MKPIPPDTEIKPAQIRALRAKLKLSRVKLAELVNAYTDCTERAIEAWETGENRIPRWYVFFLKIIVKEG